MNRAALRRAAREAFAPGRPVRPEGPNRAERRRVGFGSGNLRRGAWRTRVKGQWHRG